MGPVKHCGYKGPRNLMRNARLRAADLGVLTDDQREFLMAVVEYRSDRRKAMLTSLEYLEMALFLGYRKVAPQGEHPLTVPWSHWKDGPQP